MNTAREGHLNEFCSSKTAANYERSVALTKKGGYVSSPLGCAGRRDHEELLRGRALEVFISTSVIIIIFPVI